MYQNKSSFSQSCYPKKLAHLFNSQNDIEVWKEFKTGNRMAFEAIFRRYHETLRLYGSKICSDSGMLEDAIQDLFVELWQSKSNAPIQSVKAYLLKALKYKLFRALKSSRKRSIHLPDNDDLDFNFAHDNTLISAEEEKLRSLKINGILQQLPSRQREIIYLRIYQNLDYSEISEIMGINYQVARNLFYQSMKSLRQSFSEQF